jgi:hypothetical protein
MDAKLLAPKFNANPRLSDQAFSKAIDDEKRSVVSGQSVKTLSPALFFESATVKSAAEIGMSKSSASRTVTKSLRSRSSKNSWIRSKALSQTTPRPSLTLSVLLCSTSMLPSCTTKICSMITGRNGSIWSTSLRPIASSFAPATLSWNLLLRDPAFSTSLSVRSMSTVSLPLTKVLAASSSPRPSLRPKLTGDQAARPPRPNPKGSRHRSKWWSLIPHSLKRTVDMVVRLAHPTATAPVVAVAVLP